MSFFITLLTFVLLAYHIRVYRRLPGVRSIAAYLVAMTALSAFWSGFYLAMQEDARSRYGQVVNGIVVEKLTSTGVDGTRTIGQHDVDIRTSNGTRVYDMLARRIVSGSPTAWVVDYWYDCGQPQRCSGRDFVPRELWLRLQAGAPVAVRYVPKGIGGERLDNNPEMMVAIAEMGVGLVFALVAAVVAGFRPSFGRRVHRLETSAVVTAVEQVQFLGVPRWRVRFAYLDDLGGSREATDHFMTDTWKPGDVGVAVYDVAQPEIAGLRHSKI